MIHKQAKYHMKNRQELQNRYFAYQKELEEKWNYLDAGICPNCGSLNVRKMFFYNEKKCRDCKYYIFNYNNLRFEERNAPKNSKVEK